MKTFHAGEKKAHVGRVLFIGLHREFDVEFDLLYFVCKVFFTLLNDVWMVDFEMNKLLLTLKATSK